MANKYLDSAGLLYFWNKIKQYVTTAIANLHLGDTYVAKEEGKGLSTNDYTDAEKEKLAGVQAGAEVNVQSDWNQTDNQKDDFIKNKPEVAGPSSTTPLMDGTAAVGTATTYARADHRHPTDTTRVAANAAITGATKTKITYDSKGLVTAGADLTASDIPTIPVSKLDGVTASAAELNILDGATVTTAELNTLDGITATTSELNILHGATVTTNELNVLDGITASTEELNVLDGITATTQELNYTDGVTGPIQDQLDAKADKIVNATAGNLVTVDEGGNIVDSGITAGEAGADTKNTAGATDSNKKLFLVGAEAQSASPQTYTQDTAYVGTDGHLYSDSKQVVNISGTQTLTNKTLTSPTISSANLTGTPIAPTAAAGTNTTQVATTQFVTSAIATASSDYVQASTIGQADGIASLDSNGKVPSSQLPSYVDDVVEAYPRTGQTALSAEWLSTTSGGAALTPETGVIYVLMVDSGDYSANSQFRWSGTSYVKLNDGGVSAITNAEIDTITAS